MKDIAKELNVSLTTVSNVINNKTDRVSPETQRKVKDLINKYNYVPNYNARSLTKSDSRLIALLYYSDNPDYDFKDPFAASVLNGIENIARNNGYFVLLHNITDAKDLNTLQNSWRFSGFIAVGFTQEIFDQIILSVEVPIIFIDTYVDNEDSYDNVTFINTDDYSIGYEAGKHAGMSELSRVAFLSYEFDKHKKGVISSRFQGYKKAIKENSLQFNEEVDVFCEDNISVLVATIDQYDFIFITADMLSLKLVDEFKIQKKDIKSISMISVDNILYSNYLTPSLTTFDLNQEVKGEIAMQILSKEYTGEQNANKIIIPHTIVYRDSYLKVRSDG